MKTIINLLFVVLLLTLMSCSKKEQPMQKFSDSTAENEGLYKEEIIVKDKSGENSAFFAIYSDDNLLLNRFLKNNKLTLSINIDNIKDLRKNDLTKHFIKNKQNLNNFVLNEEPKITIELITTNFKPYVSSYSLLIKQNSNKSFVIGYPIGYVTKNNFIGVVHLGWGYEFLIKEEYKSHWYSKWKFITDEYGANTWYIYPTGPYYGSINETWSLYKRGIVVYPCYYQNTTNYRIAYSRNDFRGHNCTIGGYDGVNCYIGTPPEGTTAFIYANNFYYTPINGNQCPREGSWFDGANCFVMNIPENCDPFIWNNKWYVKPDIINDK